MPDTAIYTRVPLTWRRHSVLSDKWDDYPERDGLPEPVTC